MKKKVLLIGWDAADWNIINPMLAAGKLPALQGLIEEGVSGNLSTMNPPYSPMLWTSVATGKTPDKHGVLGFIEIDVNHQIVRPVTVNQRKVKALWNILHHHGLKSNVVGWWPSFPAEPINGHVVSDLFSKIKGKNLSEWTIPDNSLYPSSLGEELKDLRVHADELTANHILPFIPRAAEIPEKDKAALGIFTKIMAENSTIHSCSTYLMDNKEWDFTAVYFDMIDHFCHAFMKYYPPKLPQIAQIDFDIYNQVIESAYRFQDMMLETTLKSVDEDTLVIVMSDHGYVSNSARMIHLPDIHAAPALEHREFGIFVAKGPGIKKGEKVFGTSLLDVAPTILNYFDIPIGEDFDGTVMKDIFVKAKTSKYIPSWESVQGDFGLLQQKIEGDVLSSQAAMEQLIELGYVQRPDENIEVAIRNTSFDLKFNLARVFIGKGEKGKAIALLKELLEEADKIEAYLVDLIHLHVLDKEYAEARKYMDQLRLMDIKYISGTRIQEAKILLGEGKRFAAETILNDLSQQNRSPSPAHFELARIYIGINKFEKALEHVDKAIAFNPDHAKYQHAKAICLLRLDRLEEAIDAAFLSVELVRYYPDAHYTIGEILEKMGDLDNAKKAYETAKMLQPKLKRADLALENIQHQTSPQQEMASTSKVDQFPEIIVVSGLPRSGTSMMMQMLQAGGIDILSDGVRTKDESNPKGYYEFEKVKSLYKENDWLTEAEGKCIKVIAHLLKHLPVGFRYKVIFMTRAIEEVLVSQEIMLKKHNIAAKQNIEESFQQELKLVDNWHKVEPGVEMIKLAYHEVVENPLSAAKSLGVFLGKSLDLKAMQEAVSPDLYRNRVLRL